MKRADPKIPGVVVGLTAAALLAFLQLLHATRGPVLLSVPAGAATDDADPLSSDSSGIKVTLVDSAAAAAHFGALPGSKSGGYASHIRAWRETLDALHAEVGASLATAWKLPETTAISLRWHHSPGAAPSALDSVRTTTLCDHLAHWAASGGAITDDAIRALPQVGELNLYPEMMDSLLLHKDRALAFADALS